MKVLVAIVIAALLFTSGLTSSISAQSDIVATQTGVGSYVTRANIFVRGGPGESYQPVGSLRAGDALIPVSQNEAGTWVLIVYYRSFGWVRRDLGFWRENIDALPIIIESELTPTFVAGSETPTPFFTTPTPQGNWVTAGEGGAYVRTGPGFRYPIYGELDGGDRVIPVGRNTDTSWILLRLNSGFAWINRRLVSWADDLETLPILQINALTPSATFTVTLTPSATLTPSVTPTTTSTPTPSLTPTTASTPTPSVTPTIASTPTPSVTFTPSVTPSLTPSGTFTWTLTPTFTASPSATLTLPTLTLTETPTSVPPTSTLTPTLTETPSPNPPTFTPITPTQTPNPPTMTASPTLTLTATATSTTTFTPVTPTATFSATTTSSATLTMISPTSTDMLTPLPILPNLIVLATATEPVVVVSPELPTNTPPTPSQTNTPVPTQTPSASPVPPTATQSATDTAMPSMTFTATRVLPTATITLTATATRMPPTAIVMLVPPVNTPMPLTTQTVSDPMPGMPTELIVGSGGVLLVLGYIGLYWRGVVGAERYKDGFIIDRCPVCGRGSLRVDTTVKRTLGVARTRFTVRCTDCRSVLREAGERRWRYAVDPSESPVLYDQYNNRVIDETTLPNISQQVGVRQSSPHVRTPVKPPSFIDNEES